MQILCGEAYLEAFAFICIAGQVARDSSCNRRKCGSIIVRNGEVIGKGFNSPPANLESHRRCHIDKSNYHNKVTDKTCCVHAEQRAIVNALRRNASIIPGSTLYFAEIDDKDEMVYAGKPYCTVCSKMALDVGIEDIVLFHESGIHLYKSTEYNSISYEY